MLGSLLSPFLSTPQVQYASPIGAETPGESRVYRNVKSLDKLHQTPEEHIQSLQDMLVSAKDRFKNKQCLGTLDKDRVYQWKTYNQVFENSKAIGSAILQKDLAPKFQEFRDYDLNFITIYSKNREEYLTLEMACALYGIVSVPIYDTLGPSAMNYILSQTKVQTLFCSDQTLAQIMKDPSQLADIKTIVCFDEFTEQQQQQLEKQGIKMMKYSELIDFGMKNQMPLPALSLSTIYTFSYTSGTTGNPKGAMLTHGNLLSVMVAVKLSDIQLYETDVHLSYLPLAHIFEKVIFLNLVYVGAKIGFSCGDTLKLKDDMAILKPTIFASVPRIYNRFYDAIKLNLSKLTGLKKKIANQAVSSKLSYLQKYASLTHRIWDRLVFNKIKQAFGGHVRIMVTAAAPISTSVLDFLKICSCCQILEGYGQTESTGASFVTCVKDPLSGHVGGPTVNTEFKVVDVAEMGYTSKDKDTQGRDVPRGEVWIRGPGVFVGYYKDEEKTQEAISQDGWLKTGDIGQINTNGSLKLIDRKKNIFKLAQGEYVAAEKIEITAQSSSSVDEIFIYGDSLQSVLVAVMLPKKSYIMDKAKELNLEGEFAHLVTLPQMKDLVLKDLEKTLRSAKLLGFEIPKKVHLINDTFANLGLATATQKLKRHEAKKYFEKEIEGMYQQLN